MSNKYLYTFQGENGAIYQILKPSRKLRDEKELYYLKTVNCLIKEGIMPQAAYAQKVHGNADVTTDEKRSIVGRLIQDLRETHEELNKIKVIPEEEKTEQDRQKELDLNVKLGVIDADLQEYQAIKQQEFSNTAEGVALDKTHTWLAAHLSYKNDNPLFPGNTLDEKLDYAETIEDESELNAIARLRILVMAYSNGKCLKVENFEKIDKEILELLNPVKSEVSEETKEAAAILEEKSE